MLIAAHPKSFVFFQTLDEVRKHADEKGATLIYRCVLIETRPKPMPPAPPVKKV